MKSRYLFTNLFLLVTPVPNRFKHVIKIFLLLISFLFLVACNNIITSGDFEIKYDNDLKSLKSIKTFSNGFVFLKDDCNKNTIKIFPNTVIEKINNQYSLKEGVYLIIEKDNNNYKKINIVDDVFFDNELGKCQFYRIKFPKYFKFSSSNIKIRYHLQSGIKNIDAKLQPIKTFDNKNNYYGFFIPLVSNWDFDYYSISVELFNNNEMVLQLYKTYSIVKKEFEIQQIFFNHNKSRELIKYDRKKYINEKEIRDNIFLENNPPVFTSNGYYYPLFDNLTRELRLSNGKLFSRISHHSGLDYAQVKGTDIFAASDGLVRYAGFDELFGNTIVIEHGMSLCTVYSHLDKILISVGAFVKKGDLIGKMGDTGSATGPHLHWEARVYGIPVDPRSFIALEQVFIP